MKAHNVPADDTFGGQRHIPLKTAGEEVHHHVTNQPTNATRTHLHFLLEQPMPHAYTTIAK